MAKGNRGRPRTHQIARYGADKRQKFTINFRPTISPLNTSGFNLLSPYYFVNYSDYEIKDYFKQEYKDELEVIYKNILDNLTNKDREKIPTKKLSFKNLTYNLLLINNIMKWYFVIDLARRNHYEIEKSKLHFMMLYNILANYENLFSIRQNELYQYTTMIALLISEGKTLNLINEKKARKILNTVEYLPQLNIFYKWYSNIYSHVFVPYKMHSAYKKFYKNYTDPKSERYIDPVIVTIVNNLYYYLDMEYFVSKEKTSEIFYPYIPSLLNFIYLLDYLDNNMRGRVLFIHDFFNMLPDYVSILYNYLNVFEFAIQHDEFITSNKNNKITKNDLYNFYKKVLIPMLLFPQANNFRTLPYFYDFWNIRNKKSKSLFNASTSSEEVFNLFLDLLSDKNNYLVDTKDYSLVSALQYITDKLTSPFLGGQSERTYKKIQEEYKNGMKFTDLLINTLNSILEPDKKSFNPNKHDIELLLDEVLSQSNSITAKYLLKLKKEHPYSYDILVSIFTNIYDYMTGMDEMDDEEAFGHIKVYIYDYILENGTISNLIETYSHLAKNQKL